MVNNTDIHGFKAVAVALILIITGRENWINGIFLTCSRPRRSLKHSSPSSLSHQPSWLWCQRSHTLLQLLLAPLAPSAHLALVATPLACCRLSGSSVIGVSWKVPVFKTFKTTILILSYVWAEVIFVNIFLLYSCFWTILYYFFCERSCFWDRIRITVIMWSWNTNYIKQSYSVILKITSG